MCKKFSSVPDTEQMLAGAQPKADGMANTGHSSDEHMGEHSRTRHERSLLLPLRGRKGNSQERKEGGELLPQ